MADYTEALNLYLPNRNDSLAVDESLSSNFRKLDDYAQEMEEKLEVLEEGTTTKEFELEKAVEMYLFDLELTERTVNQGLVVDEKNNVIYASQVYLPHQNNVVESFRITRVSLGGVKIDDMLIQYGGHGTSFGVEVDENGDPYIWSLMIQKGASDTKEAQWLSRFPYIPNETIAHDDSRVQKLLELPTTQTMTPLVDDKNGLVAMRITEGGSTKINVYNMDNAKNGEFNTIYSYSFTEEMNNSVLQGMAIDGGYLYLTFGQYADDFHLFVVDMSDGSYQELKRTAGLSPTGGFVEGFGEPEGLFMYTDPETGYKTLLCVIVGAKAQRRLQRLFAFTSNDGVKKFQGLGMDKAQQVKITRNDGKAKRLDMEKVTSLTQVVEPGSYYVTTAESSQLSDHPMKGVAGWWLDVSGKNSDGDGVHQTLIRNSLPYADRFVRVTRGNDDSGWYKVSLTKV